MARKAIAATAKVTSKGQVTIPKEVRDELGLSAGASVRFEGTRASMRIVPSGKPESFAKYIGWGVPGKPKGMNAVEYVRWLRGGELDLD